MQPRRHESYVSYHAIPNLCLFTQEGEHNLHDRIFFSFGQFRTLKILPAVHHAPSSPGLARRSKSSKTATSCQRSHDQKNRFLIDDASVCGASISAFACFGSECKRKSRAVVFGLHESLTASFIQLSAHFIKSPREGRSKV